MTSIADLLAGPAPRAKADRTGMYRLYDNFIGIDDGVTTPGERLGAGINGLGSALLSDPVGVISGMALGVKDDLDDLMFQGGAERRPEDVLGYAAAPMAPGALRGRVANVVSSGGAKPKKGIRAYHGSPHDFDRFSMDKIGTGEGAQAYGHGLYFAESEDVARSYRDALAPGMGDGALRAIGISDGDLRTMRQFTQSSVDPDIALRDWLGWTGKRETPELRAAFMQEWNGRNPGRMYEVRINANPDDFLDWDAPLMDQPAGQKITNDFESLRQEILGKLPEIDGSVSMPEYETKYGNDLSEAARLRVNPEWTGAQLYESSRLVPGDFRDPHKAAKELMDRGIPGIKYRDAGSRGLDGQSGTRNFVVFDENLIEIVRKYGIAGAAAMLGISAQELQAQVDQQQSQKSGADEITEYLQSIGAQ